LDKHEKAKQIMLGDLEQYAALGTPEELRADLAELTEYREKSKHGEWFDAIELAKLAIATERLKELERQIESGEIKYAAQCWNSKRTENGECYGWLDGAGDPMEECELCKIYAEYNEYAADELRSERCRPAGKAVTNEND